MENSDETTVPVAKTENNELLLEAFKSFSEASLQLEKAYNDLSERTRELDLELQETNQKLRTALVEEERSGLQLRGILDTLTSGILVIDLEGVVVDINPSAIKLLGVERERIHYSQLGLPKPITDFIYRCIESTMPRGPKTEVSITRNGNQLDLELSFSLVRPIGGGILSVLVMVNDVTLINRLQSQSKRNVRLAAMGEMAAELAHEIRNPLGSIKLFSSLLESDLDQDPDKKNLASQISHGVQVLESIVSNMLTFSANVTPKRSALKVCDLLAQSLPLFEAERLRKEIRLDYHEPPSDLMLMGDEHLLKQVFLNLCNNAIRAMEKGGKLHIRARAGEEFVEILVQDNGIGIPEEQIYKIFDPFYTTFQGGTGLGLSVVNQIIEKHGGAIDVKSKINEGTSFYVSLPRTGPGYN